MNPSVTDLSQPAAAGDEAALRLSPTPLLASSWARAVRQGTKKGRLPPKKRKVHLKHVAKVPMTILKRQVASYWKPTPATTPSKQPPSAPMSPRTVSRTATPVSGSPFYLEHYGEKALNLYPDGPQTLLYKKAVLRVPPSEDPSKFIHRRPSTTPVDLSQIWNDGKSYDAVNAREARLPPTSLEYPTKQSPKLRHGVVTPSPMLASYAFDSSSSSIPEGTGNIPQYGTTLKPTPLRRSRPKALQTMGTHENPIVVDTASSYSTEHSVATHHAVRHGTGRAAHTNAREVPHVRHVTFATAAAQQGPGPDRSTPCPPAFTPVRPVPQEPRAADPRSHLGRHPLHQPGQSGRRAAAFSPRK